MNTILTGSLWLGTGIFCGCVGVMAYVVFACRIPDCITRKKKYKSMLMDDNY